MAYNLGNVWQNVSSFMNPSHLDKLKELSIFTTSDAAQLGITRAALGRAVEKKLLERLQRGLYGYVGRELSLIHI